MSAPPAAGSIPALDDRWALFDRLLSCKEEMLLELAQVAGVVPPERLQDEPQEAFDRVATFVDTTDFRPATDDARTWLLNRLGLYIASWFIKRHGGDLRVQSNKAERFYLHFVVADMLPPAPSQARLAPFAIAYDAINADPRIGLQALVDAAEQALGIPTGGLR